MLEILKVTEGTNDGEIFENETEFLLDDIPGTHWYGWNWYEPLEYSYHTIRWGGLVIDRNNNSGETSIKGVEVLTQTQIDELSNTFGCWIKEVIESGNYTKF